MNCNVSESGLNIPVLTCSLAVPINCPLDALRRCARVSISILLNMKMKPLLTTLIASTFACSTASAVLVGGVGQRASSDLPQFNRIATYATNGAGLTGTAHSELPSGTMWLSANGDVAGAFELDLGAVYAVNSIRVWNYNEGLAGRPDLLQRGVASANIDLGLTPSAYTTQIGGQAFAQAPGTNTDFSQVINLSGAQTRFIRLDILGNHGDAQFTGLSEIQVDGTLVSGQRPLAASISGVSSTIGAPFNRLPEHTVNYNGVFSRTHSVIPDANMWLGGEGDIAPTITFDLGSAQPLANMVFWNYNEFLPGRPDLLQRGVRQADILLSNDGVTFSPFANDVMFAIAPGDNTTEFAETVNLSGASARFVRLAVDANHGDASYTGISEVQFFAIPEPSTAWLIAGPLAAFLFSRRRR